MGNSGSINSTSHQQQQQQQHCPLSSEEIGRGWTHSFPQELTRHHSQPPGHKVLPEPPNQRLRATNNGSIIHNGGTISGRRPSALTLPHDLNKGVYRSRSSSASNLGHGSRSNEPHHHHHHHQQQQHHCCLYRLGDPRCRETEMTELKRFGSEPDLRYSPKDQSHHHHQETRHSGYYPERESRERESRYRGKKKYKAPAPPINGEDSSPESYKWEIVQDHREGCCRPEEEAIPPIPRRSRLFKTRAETKKAQSNWNAGGLPHQDNESFLESERRWRSDKNSSGDKENRAPWREQRSEQDRWSRDERRSSKKFDGKNTLQRSLSSPEFQAELMQVARKVRNKLNCNRRVGPIGAAAAVVSSDQKSEAQRFKKAVSASDLQSDDHPDRKNNQARLEDRLEDRRTEKRKPKNLDEPFEPRTEGLRSSNRFHKERRSQNHKRGIESRASRTQEVREGYEDQRLGGDHRNSGRRKEIPEERPLENGGGGGGGHRRRIVEHARESSSGPRNRKNVEAAAVEVVRTRSESPAMRNSRDRMDVRGQGSGRESTPEPPRGKNKNSADHRKGRSEIKDVPLLNNEQIWAESRTKTSLDNVDFKGFEKKIGATLETTETQPNNWNGLPPTGKAQPKTYYFCVDDGLTREIGANAEQQQQLVDHFQSRLPERDSNNLSNNPQNRTNDRKNQNAVEDIALKLRPTLPKKQLEIPRFSPSAAWRLLSALEAPGPTMSTASEEVPVMFEERIERLTRPPPPLVALSPRSSHDKSGDSGISGDAGAGNDDSLDVSTTNRVKTPATRPTWTPQEDLGEESSNDAGVDSPPPMPPSMKFPPRAHVFSLSLPRDDTRHSLYPSETKNNSKENSSFNSLQKLKRSVSGALGLGSNEIECRKRPGEGLSENWLLSSSAPNSLQYSQVNQIESSRNASPGWDNNNYTVDDMDDEAEDLEDSEDKTGFPMVMKPPSFSYLASGGHVMYLPESNDTEHRTQSLNYRNSGTEIGNNLNNVNFKYRKNSEETRATPNKIGSFGINGISIDANSRDVGIYRERSFTDFGAKSRKYQSFFKSCDNVSEMRQRSASPTPTGPEDLQDPKATTGNVKSTTKNSKSKRFTFQSTVRQIERRRLAEKLSREAEAKERQRKSELEVMRKVEEEFQRKRAKEKANIRQQLRLYSMDVNSSNLPPTWDSSQVSRADPDGAPSSSASSPISASPGKMANNRTNSIGSDEYQHRKKRVSESRVQQQQQQQQPAQHREYKDYRPKYYDWAPESSSHLEVKHTTVHPKVVYDIPKNSHVFVDANIHTAKPANVTSTPRSDNYRKDFAHGAVAARSSLASSDSELSQPNTRPHSRQNDNKSKPMRSRSASPERSDGAGSAGEESPVEAVKHERNVPVNGFVLNGVQPFVREKSYRPISFNPRPPPPVPS